MEQYIPKSALVAEIEKETKTLMQEIPSCENKEHQKGKLFGLQRALYLIDTLEVKEVDLEEEIERVRKTHFINDDFEKATLEGRQITNIAKHLEKIRAEIERAMKWEKEQAAHSYGNVCLLHECREDMCKKFLSFIDSMQKKTVSEEQVKESAEIQHVSRTCKENGDSLIQEPASEDLEEEVIKKVLYFSENFHKAPWAIDSTGAVMPIWYAKFGANWQKEQMMSKAIDALVHTFDNGYIRVGTQLLANNEYGLKVGDKVKVIIIKDK